MDTTDIKLKINSESDRPTQDDLSRKELLWEKEKNKCFLNGRVDWWKIQLIMEKN